PTSTRSPRSWLSERSSFSVLPSRRAWESETPSNSTASAASAPAFSARPTRSCSRSIALSMSLFCVCAAIPMDLYGESFPDRSAAARETEACPFAGDLLDNALGHPNGPAPVALCFRRHFVGRVQPDLAAQPRFGRGEV